MRYGIVCGHLRRCNEIFAMRKGWYGVMGVFAITAMVSLLWLCRGKRGE